MLRKIIVGEKHEIMKILPINFSCKLEKGYHYKLFDFSRGTSQSSLPFASCCSKFLKSHEHSRKSRALNSDLDVNPCSTCPLLSVGSCRSYVTSCSLYMLICRRGIKWKMLYRSAIRVNEIARVKHGAYTP